VPSHHELGDVGDSPPGSFAVDLGEWDRWLLAHGLPELPDAVAAGEAVPVAVWVGSRWAATLHLVYRDSDEDASLGEPSLDTEEQAFRWSGEEWEAAGASGGTSWSPGLDLKPPALGPREVWTGGLGRYGGPDWNAGVVGGLAGADAASVEVQSAAGIESAPFSSPVGAWLVAFDGRREAVLRVRDADGIDLCERRVDPL